MLVPRRAGLIITNRGCLRRAVIMKTTIKSVRMDKLDGNFTGKVIVNIPDEITGFIREVHDGGVIEFKQAQLPQFKIALSALSAQCRNVIDEKLLQAFGYRLDSAKLGGVEELVNVLNVILSGATIEIDSELKKGVEDDTESHDAIFYKITSLKLSQMMSYLVAQHFVENFMKVADMDRQQVFIKQLFGVTL